MRIVICGDTHIGAVYGLGHYNGEGGNTRVDDYEKSLNHIIDYTIDSEADVFIQTGDAFDSRTPSPEHFDVMNKALRRLSVANITSIVIMGNHDYVRKGDTYKSSISSMAAKNYPNVRMVLEPTVMKVSDTTGKSVDILLIPYRDRRMYNGKSTKEDSDLFDAQMLELIDSCSGKSPIIAVGHNFFYEGSYSDYGGTEILSDSRVYNKCDLYVMGHYHQFKKIRDSNPKAFYTGSMDKLNFGDEDVDKYFFDYDVVLKKVKVLKVPSVPLIDLNYDYSVYDIHDLKKIIEEQLRNENIKDNIVRLKISVRDSALNSVKKSFLEKLLYSLGAHHVSKITIVPVLNRVNKSNEILKEKDELSMMKAFLIQQDAKPEEIDKLLKEAKDIMEKSFDSN